MTITAYPNGIVSFEIEPDPQAAEKLKDLMAQFFDNAAPASSNAAVTPSKGGLLLATTSNIPPDTGISDAMKKRLDDIVVFKPLDEETLKKVFDVATGRLLDKKDLTPRQRGAAEKFIAGSRQEYDSGLGGVRGMTKNVAKLLDSSAFTELMAEHSPGGTQRSFEKAIKGGIKALMPVPPTARFTRRRTP